MSKIWQDAGTFGIRRELPMPVPGGKYCRYTSQLIELLLYLSMTGDDNTPSDRDFTQPDASPVSVSPEKMNWRYRLLYGQD